MLFSLLLLYSLHSAHRPTHTSKIKPPHHSCLLKIIELFIYYDIAWAVMTLTKTKSKQFTSNLILHTNIEADKLSTNGTEVQETVGSVNIQCECRRVQYTKIHAWDSILIRKHLQSLNIAHIGVWRVSPNKKTVVELQPCSSWTYCVLQG